jgi:hypothetical protein
LSPLKGFRHKRCIRPILVRLGLIIFLSNLLAGCGMLPTLPTREIFPSETPTLTLTVTPTIVWFPPTITPTFLSGETKAPTPEQRPAVGTVIIQDTFEDTSLWSTFSGAAGKVAYGNHELTLAVAQVKSSLFSLRSSSLPGDFYLEITASPSLCRGEDAYGLLLRATSNLDTYRFLVSCRGRLRLERLNNGVIALLQDWSPSGQVPPGSPLIIRLGVWAVRNELRFFVNGYYQFGVRDPAWTGGTLGLFARSAADPPLSVSFSDLVVQAIDYERLPTPVLTATITPTSTKKK